MFVLRFEKSRKRILQPRMGLRQHSREQIVELSSDAVPNVTSEYWFLGSKVSIKEIDQDRNISYSTSLLLTPVPVKQISLWSEVKIHMLSRTVHHVSYVMSIYKIVARRKMINVMERWHKRHIVQILLKIDNFAAHLHDVDGKHQSGSKALSQAIAQTLRIRIMFVAHRRKRSS